MTDPSPGGPANPWPPASGPAAPPAYPQQVSAVPVGAQPGYPAPAPTQIIPIAAAKTSPWVWVLIALSAVLLLGAAGVGVLYASTSSDNDKRVAQRDDTIEDLESQADDLAATKSDLDKQITEANDAVDDAQGEFDALRGCQTAINAFGVANKAAIDGVGTLAAVDAAFDAMLEACGAR